MRPPLETLKHDFLKKWCIGLRLCNSSKSLLERKKVIKLSADLAMASTRDRTTCWSRALIADASKDEQNKFLLDRLIIPPYNDQCESIKKVPKNIRCKKIVKRSFCVKRVRKCGARTSSNNVAKRLLKKRTQVLKSLVPGGEFMDDVCLIEETLDYILSLRAQVDVMRSLANIN